MKKTIVIVLALVMAISMAACGNEVTVMTAEEKSVTVANIEELELLIEEDISGTTSALAAEYEELTEAVGDFEAYQKNVATVQAFYDKIYEENRNICIRIREYSIAYARLIVNSGETNDEKFDMIDDMYDCLYDNTCEAIYDAIYDDMMGDMYDAFYDGVVSDGYDYIGFDKWYDMSSDAYDMWSDCGSDIYDVWSDCGSDVYDFWSDVYDAIYDGDDAEMAEVFADFEEDINALKEEE